MKNKKIILGICGSIAAYKSAQLVRLFKKAGFEVRVIMTPAATSFVGPLTFSTLSQNPVNTEFYNPNNGEWINHVEIGNWGDVFLIAPCSANTLGKLANGLSDDLLSCVYLSCRCPVFIAPAMDLQMFHHPATQHNLKTLTERGDIILNVDKGELASGMVGEGRMKEPQEIFGEIEKFFAKGQELKKKKYL